MAEVASFFFDHPSRKMDVVGITGTNGKTTTAYLVHHLVRHSAGNCGLIGTVKYDTGAREFEAERTTPESVDLQALLGEARDFGCRATAMEVSSHALAQHRVHAVRFAAAVFTNLSQDHLDFHEGMEDYFNAKRSLFHQTAGDGGKAIINIDDSFGRRLVTMMEDKLEIATFGHGASATYRAANPRTTKTGTEFQLYAGTRSFLVETPLFGAFNVSNSLAAITAVASMGFNLRETVNAMREAPQIPGRLEAINERRPFRVFVDYAHTPDALANVLRTLRTMTQGRLITVFGCGGDRDREKRPLMARAAEELSDICVVTSDNPRSEDPAQIIDDVERGLKGKYVSIVDRREAIHEAIRSAQEGDVVLVAGKGHETYQQIGDERLPFDDRKVATSAMREWRAEQGGNS